MFLSKKKNLSLHHQEWGRIACAMGTPALIAHGHLSLDNVPASVLSQALFFFIVTAVKCSFGTNLWSSRQATAEER